MKETLTCTSCSKTWKRESIRGRKPKFCPKCVKASQKDIQKKSSTLSSSVKAKKKQSSETDLKEPANVEDSLNDSSILSSLSYGKVYSSFYPPHPDADDLMESTKNGSSWQCPSCKLIVRPSIRISQPPTHKCTPNSASVKEFIRID
jgi:NAD-dependent SIR2 family protein deacetylase